jgi:hypothetical protein
MDYRRLLEALAEAAMESQYRRGANVFGVRPPRPSPDLFVRRAADELEMPASYERAVDQGMRELGIPGRSEVTNRQINTTRRLPDDMTVDEAAQLIDAVQQGAMLRATPVMGSGRQAGLMEFFEGRPRATQYAQDFGVDENALRVLQDRVASKVETDIGRYGDEAFVTGQAMDPADISPAAADDGLAGVFDEVWSDLGGWPGGARARGGEERAFPVPAPPRELTRPEIGREPAAADDGLVDLFDDVEVPARAMPEPEVPSQAGRRLGQAAAAAAAGIGATALLRNAAQVQRAGGDAPLEDIVLPDVAVDVPFEVPGITDTGANDAASYMEQFTPIQDLDIIDPDDIVTDGPFSEPDPEMTLDQYIAAMTAAESRVLPSSIAYLRDLSRRMAPGANPRATAIDSGEGDFLFSPDSIEGRAERKVGRGLARAVRLQNAGRR